jgi:hypothetical protein
MNATSKNTGKNLVSGKGPWYLLGVLAVTIATIAGSEKVQAGDPRGLGSDVQIALGSTDAAPQPSVKRTKAAPVERKTPIWDSLFSNWEPVVAGPALNLSLDGFKAWDATADGDLQSAERAHIANCYDTAEASRVGQLNRIYAGQGGFLRESEAFYVNRVHDRQFERCAFGG